MPKAPHRTASTNNLMGRARKPTADQLFAQEKADVQAERATLDQRATDHELWMEADEASKHAHEVRMLREKARRDLAAEERLRLRQSSAATEEADAKLSAKTGELLALQAAKEAARTRETAELEALVAEGEALADQQRVYRERARTKAWQKQEKADSDMAAKAKLVHETTQKLAKARQEDHGAIAVLFRVIDVDHSGFIQPDEFVWVMGAIVSHGPLSKEGEQILSADHRRIGAKKFKLVLRDFDASVNGRVSLSGMKHWWDNKGILGKGLGCQTLRVSATGESGHGSASALVSQTIKCIQMQTELEAATGIQSCIRRRQSQKLFVEAKKNGTLPGSTRVAATKIQAVFRMRVARRQYNNMRKASITISSALRRRHAMVTFQITQDTKKNDEYSFATRSVHVGGIGKEWEDEEKLMAWFARGGPVLTAVVRIRAPERDLPNNSWALLVFKHEETLNDLLRQHRDHSARNTAQADVVRLKADAGDKADDAVVFVVRRIDPMKAMTSVGSFGKVFQTCVEKVTDEQKRLRRETKARVKREEERQNRWRGLATKPQIPKLTKAEVRKAAAGAQMIADMHLSWLHKQLDRGDDGSAAAPAPAAVDRPQEQIVIAEYLDGWRYCCQWPPTDATVYNPAPTLKDMEQQGHPYYFNTRSGESRWLPPPQLTRLSKTKPKGQFAKLNKPVATKAGSAEMTAAAESNAEKLPAAPVRKAGKPHVPKLSARAASSIYTLQPRLWLSGAERGRRQSAGEPTTAEIRGVLRAGGGRADGHQRLPMSPRRPGTASGGGGRARTNRRVVEMPGPAAVAAEEDMDPVAYMEQWQHQKCASGPKSREYDCFMPGAFEIPASPQIWAGKLASVR